METSQMQDLETNICDMTAESAVKFLGKTDNRYACP